MLNKIIMTLDYLVKIKDEEELYQSLKNISNNLNDNKTAKVNTILMEHLFS